MWVVHDCVIGKRKGHRLRGACVSEGLLNKKNCWIWCRTSSSLLLCVTVSCVTICTYNGRYPEWRYDSYAGKRADPRWNRRAAASCSDGLWDRDTSNRKVYDTLPTLNEDTMTKHKTEGNMLLLNSMVTAAGAARSHVIHRPIQSSLWGCVK